MSPLNVIVLHRVDPLNLLLSAIRDSEDSEIGFYGKRIRKINTHKSSQFQSGRDESRGNMIRKYCMLFKVHVRPKEEPGGDGGRKKYESERNEIRDALSLDSHGRMMRK